MNALGTLGSGIVSRAFVEQHGKATGTPSVGILATGPYKFVSWSPGESVVLERFDDYWDDARALKVRQYVGRVVTDTSTQLALLQSGQGDGLNISGLPGRQLALLDATKTINLVTTATPRRNLLGAQHRRPGRSPATHGYAKDSPTRWTVRSCWRRPGVVVWARSSNRSRRRARGAPRSRFHEDAYAARCPRTTKTSRTPRRSCEPGVATESVGHCRRLPVPTRIWPAPYSMLANASASSCKSSPCPTRHSQPPRLRPRRHTPPSSRCG